MTKNMERKTLFDYHQTVKPETTVEKPINPQTATMRELLSTGLAILTHDRNGWEIRPALKSSRLFSPHRLII
jgi:hypothetical protein